MKISRPHLLLALLSLGACGGDSTGPDTSVASVQVSPQSPSVDVGLTVQFSAQALNASGQPVGGQTATWNSSNGTVASISVGGLATGLSVGTTTITATIGDVPGSQVLSVQLGQCQGRVDVILSPGESQSYDGNTCLLLPSGQAGDRYRVAIVRPTLIENAADVPNVTLDVDLILSAAASPSLGPVVGVVGTSPAVGAAPLPRTFPGIDGTRFVEDMRLRAATRRFHNELRARERELGLFDMPVLRGPPNLGPARSSHPDPPTRDDMFLDLDCSLVVSRPVIRIDFNDDVVIYQDSVEWFSAPLDPDATGQILAYYTAYIRDMVTQYWGAPSDLDANGRVIIVTSPSLAADASAAVYSGDFFPTTGPGACPSSNQGEVIYFRASVISALVDPDPSYAGLGTVAHELKHVVSLYNSLVRGTAHERWIEEGTAEISQVMSSRIAWAATGGPPIGTEIDGNDIIDAINLNLGAPTPEMWSIIDEIADLVIHMSTQPNSLITDPNGASVFHNFYAGTWQWHRFIGDAWGNAATPFADASFFQALTDALDLSGTQEEARLTGRSFDELFEDLVVGISFHKTGQIPAREFSTWDFISATAIFTAPPVLAPPGRYPWPVTGDDTSPNAAFVTATFAGPMGPSGMRFHDFRSDGVGAGIQILMTGATAARIIVSRIN